MVCVVLKILKLFKRWQLSACGCDRTMDLQPRKISRLLKKNMARHHTTQHIKKGRRAPELLEERFLGFSGIRVKMQYYFYVIQRSRYPI